MLGHAGQLAEGGVDVLGADADALFRLEGERCRVDRDLKLLDRKSVV